VSLVLEVALITMQFWREVASHFNSATSFDAGMEGSMLALITVAVAGIAWIFVRSLWSPDPDPDFRLASRAGLLFLLLSCAIGYAITFVGHWNMLQGRSPEVFGPAGVLKFPHGAALHALQWLPLLVVMGKRWKLPQTRSLLQSAIVIQGLLLTHAIWQTVSGRGRTEFTVGGFLMLLAAALIAGWTLVTILRNLNPRRASLESQSIGT
jgi:hypothetical protein